MCWAKPMLKWKPFWNNGGFPIRLNPNCTQLPISILPLVILFKLITTTASSGRDSFTSNHNKEGLLLSLRAPRLNNARNHQSPANFSYICNDYLLQLKGLTANSMTSKILSEVLPKTIPPSSLTKDQAIIGNKGYLFSPQQVFKFTPFPLYLQSPPILKGWFPLTVKITGAVSRPGRLELCTCYSKRRRVLSHSFCSIFSPVMHRHLS